MEINRNQKTVTGLRAGKSSTELVYTDLCPAVDNFYNLGSTSLNWKQVYADKGSFDTEISTAGLMSANTASVNGNLNLGGDISLGGGSGSIIGNLNVVGNTQVVDLNVTGVLTFAAQPEFSRFIASNGVILKGGTLNLGGSLVRNGLLSHDGSISNTSHLVSNYFESNGYARLAGTTYIKTPLYLGSITNEAARDILIRNGDGSIIGPYASDNGIKFYYRKNMYEYYYTESLGTLF